MEAARNRLSAAYDPCPARYKGAIENRSTWTRRETQLEVAASLVQGQKALEISNHSAIHSEMGEVKAHEWKEVNDLTFVLEGREEDVLLPFPALAR